LVPLDLDLEGASTMKWAGVARTFFLGAAGRTFQIPWEFLGVSF